MCSSNASQSVQPVKVRLDECGEEKYSNCSLLFGMPGKKTRVQKQELAGDRKVEIQTTAVSISMIEGTAGQADRHGLKEVGYESNANERLGHEPREADRRTVSGSAEH